MTAPLPHAAPPPAAPAPGSTLGPPGGRGGPPPGPGGPAPGPGAAPSLLDRPAFRDDFERLASVGLDPARHTSPDARAHSLAVARRARALARAAGLGPAEARTLDD